MSTVMHETKPVRFDSTARPGGDVTLLGVLHSEWIKLRSVPSTAWTYAAAVGTLLFFGSMASAFAGGLLSAPDDDMRGMDPTGTALAGVTLVALIIGVLGVIAVTSEYSSGLIRTTMTYVPRRVPVLAAKALVLAAVTFPVMLAAVFTTWGVGQALMGAGDAGVATAALTDDGVLGALFGNAAYLTAIALMGLGFGAILRSTPAAIAALFALIFLVPGLGRFLLPASIRDEVLLYLPSNAAEAFTTVRLLPGELSAATGMATVAAWVLVPLAIAAVRLVRKSV